jgi:hypothetical protein
MSALVGEVELRPETGFELSLRGYHRAQVDRYVATLHVRLTTLETELASSRYREQQLTGRVERLDAESQKCTCGAGQSTSRLLGGRIQKILQLAEEESHALRDQAEHDLNQAHVAGDAVLAEARKHAEEAMRDFQQVLSQRRSEEARAEAARRMQWEARRERQREAAQVALNNTRAVSAESLAAIRQLLDMVASQHAALSEEVRSAEKSLANLSGV